MNQIYQVQRNDLTNGVIAELSARDTRVRQTIDEVKVSLERRVDEVKVSLERRVDEVKTDIDEVRISLEAKIDTRIAQTEKELIKWMFLFWTGSVVTILGSLFVFLKLFLRP